jgi:hypothetical protein
MAESLKQLIRAGAGLIAIESSEEREFFRTLEALLGEVLRPTYRWSITDGLKRLDMDLEPDRPLSPDSSAVLEYIRGKRERAIFVLLDFHPYLRYAASVRLLRDIAQRERCAAHTVILLSAKLELPDELKAHVQRWTPEHPTEAELALLLRDEAQAYQREHHGKRVEIERASWLPLIRLLKGLNLSAARKVARAVIFNDGAISSSDLAHAAREKFKLLNAAGVLSLELGEVALEDVAGLSRLKRWIELRKPVFRGETPNASPLKPLPVASTCRCSSSILARCTTNTPAKPNAICASL